jgi:hypothetical protein
MKCAMEMGLGARRERLRNSKVDNGRYAGRRLLKLA